MNKNIVTVPTVDDDVIKDILDKMQNGRKETDTTKP
jgi:hypothetical protein